jgi:siroheme synthase
MKWENILYCGQELSGDAMSRPQGTVQIVGAGPGSADLLTLRAIKALTMADVVVHDRLVSAEILDLIPPARGASMSARKASALRPRKT